MDKRVILLKKRISFLEDQFKNQLTENNMAYIQLLILNTLYENGEEWRNMWEETSAELSEGDQLACVIKTRLDASKSLLCKLESLTYVS